MSISNVDLMPRRGFRRKIDKRVIYDFFKKIHKLLEDKSTADKLIILKA